MRISTMEGTVRRLEISNRRHSSVLQVVGLEMSVKFEVKSKLPDVFVRPIPL
jgi:hypothetical protein